jgi:hypothetical protein
MQHAWKRSGMDTKMLVGKSEGKRPLGRHSRRWEDKIGMDFRVTEWKVVVDWIQRSQVRISGKFILTY